MFSKHFAANILPVLIRHLKSSFALLPSRRDYPFSPFVPSSIPSSFFLPLAPHDMPLHS